MVAGIMLASILMKMVVNRFSAMLQTEAGYNTCAGKRIEIAEHLRYLPMGYFNKTRLGHITSVTTNSMEQIGDVATRAIMLTLDGTITAVVIALMILIYDWRIGLITIAGIAVFALVNIYTRSMARKISPLKINTDKETVGVILEFVQEIAEVRNYNLMEMTGGKLNDQIARKEQADIKTELAVIPGIVVENFVLKVFGVLIIAASINFYLSGTMPLLDTMGMILCSFMVFSGLESAGMYASLMRAIEMGVDLANEILATEQMDIEGEDITPKTHNIHMENVSYAYEDRTIIDNMTLDIPEKTTTAIVGPSGGGKTTVTSLIARFWDVNQGTVTLDGRNVKDYSFDSLMKNFSFVFQNVYLFEDTIANNIRFSNPEASMDEVIEAAKKASCHDFIMALPNGYDTVIGERGASLSGGEKQRISIARAMMKDAPIIVLDEATANVDPEKEKELTEAIENLTREKTIILIAHRLKTVRHADKIVVIDKGHIVQEGTHNELIEQDGIYRNFIDERKRAISWKLATEA